MNLSIEKKESSLDHQDINHQDYKAAINNQTGKDALMSTPKMKTVNGFNLTNGLAGLN